MRQSGKIFGPFLLCCFIVLCHNLLHAAPSDSDFKLAPFEKFVLNNGLTVYLMEQHEVPLVYISLVFPAGAVRDGKKSGLASLAAETLLFGTKSYSKKQLEESLDFIGASYGTYAAKEFAELAISFVAQDRDTVFPILKEIVCSPSFDAQEFDKRKKRLLVELERAKEQPAQVIRAYYEKFLFQNNAYGNPASGTLNSVAALTVEDVQAFYQANYYPAGSAIAIAGDFDRADMKKAVTALLQDWKPAGAPPALADAAVAPITKSRVLLVNKEDATETRFHLGAFGIQRSNPDYVAVQVINTILGGRFTSWLNDELRVNRGLTYGASSYFAAHKKTGTFAVSSFTPTEHTIEALDVSLDILARLHQQGVDEQTLISAKKYMQGQYPLRYETAGDLASLLTAMFVYEFDESFINTFQQKVESLTTAEAARIIAKYFPRENIQFVLIGKAAEIREAAKKYGEVTEKEITADGF